jgi:hypothetical protein
MFCTGCAMIYTCRHWHAIALLMNLALSPTNTQLLRPVTFDSHVDTLWASLPTQEECNAEVKLLLPSNEILSAITSFNAKKGKPGRVYFFDTNALDLLSQGLIIRLRQGAQTDLTVKLRRPTGNRSVDIGDGEGRSKCEMDVIGGTPVRSYSIQTDFTAALPERGNQLYASLSRTQKRFLEEARVSIDWNQVKRIADIQSTSWTIKGQKSFTKLNLELWEWPTGEILELSTKVGADEGTALYTQLRQLAVTKGLQPSSSQTSKTTLALENISHTAGQ